MTDLRRGAWLSASHDQAYGRNFKMRSIHGWAGSRRLKMLANVAATRSLDIFQFGVYTAGSMRGLARSIRGFGHLYGFDSFVGLPSETRGEPLEGPHCARAARPTPTPCKSVIPAPLSNWS